MQAIEFPEQTTVLAKDQPQYLPLPVHIDQSQEGTPMICCFKLSPEELEEVNRTSVIWHRQLTFGQLLQPIMLMARNPFSEAEVVSALRSITTLKEINRQTPEGRLLLAALVKITTELHTDKTPDEAIGQLNAVADRTDQ